MAIRSGRFKSTDAKTNPLVIVRGREGAFYRVFNSGPNKFTVKQGGAGGITEELDPKMSVDVSVGGGASGIGILTTADVPIEGIYEYLEGNKDVRSGRFKVDLTDTEEHTIIDLTSDAAYYRIFNSGDDDFEVGRSTTGPWKKVVPEASFDFQAPANVKIVVRPVGGSGTITAEGIYDFLGRA